MIGLGLRLARGAMPILCLLLAASSSALAQPAPRPSVTVKAAHAEPAGKLSAASRDRIRSANILRYVGLGFSIAGWSLAAGGWIAVAVNNSSSSIAFNGLFVGLGLGGLFYIPGTISWIIGDVRHRIRTAGERWRNVRRKYKRAGLITTLSGAGVAAVGGVLYGAFGRDYGAGLAGIILLSVGLFTTVVVGISLWATAARTRGELPRSAARPVNAWLTPRSWRTDAHHEGVQLRRLNLGTPRPTLFTTAYSF